MKVKSELYVYELNMIVIGLTLQMRQIMILLDRQKKLFFVRRILAPWSLSNARTEILSNLNVLLEHAKLLDELRDKILDAEGYGDDAKPITFREMIKRQS